MVSGTVSSYGNSSYRCAAMLAPQVSAAPDHECSVKGLYALAAMVRNLREARAAFVEAGA